MLDDTLQPKQLFGGAVALGIPARFVDISDFRPVPDNQEIFADASMDQSLVVEIVEHQSGVPNEEAATFFLQDLAQVSQAVHASVEGFRRLGPARLQLLPPELYSSMAAGQQTLAKGQQQGQTALNKVQVLLCNVRIPQYGSDLLITLNTPIYIAEGSAAAEHAGAGYKGGYLNAPSLLDRMLATLQVRDWGLFGGGGGGGQQQQQPGPP